MFSVAATLSMFLISEIGVRWPDAIGRPALVWLRIALLVCTCAFAGVAIGRETRLRKRLKSAGGAICPRCGYDVSRHPEESGVCPECGRPFSKEGLRKLWAQTHLLTWPPTL